MYICSLNIYPKSLQVSNKCYNFSLLNRNKFVAFGNFFLRYLFFNICSFRVNFLYDYTSLIISPCICRIYLCFGIWYIKCIFISFILFTISERSSSFVINHGKRGIIEPADVTLGLYICLKCHESGFYYLLFVNPDRFSWSPIRKVCHI